MRKVLGGSVALAAAVAVGMGVDISGRIIEGVIFAPTREIERGAERSVGMLEDVFLRSEDGVRIHSYWLPSQKATRAVLFLHGNAGNASHRLPNAAQLRDLGAHVLLADYRGYGKSEGRPSEAGVYADARANLKHLIEERGVPEERVVLFGRSLGGAIAVDLAQGRRLAGLILESTFSSLTDVTRQALGRWGDPFTWGRFDSARKMRAVRAPLLFLHGDLDAIVPISSGRRLFTAAPEPKTFEVIRGADHNDTVWVGGEPYFERLRSFLDQVAPL